ncbi:flagellar protein FlaG [Cognaticolwellia mytili]|uniref:flagellar protein FlaG n=1 Tax=Cognaticolwellia mytili TaxID=1888913 RepID=UPI000A176CF7|nr:flagellar protein FlaG [Cognaticolwellia mytili]
MSEILTNHLNTPNIAIDKLNRLEATEVSAKEVSNTFVGEAEKNEKVVESITGKQNNVENTTISSKQLEKVAQQLQEFVGGMNKGLEFLVDKDSGRDVIKVIDRESGDTVKQYPSEEVLGLIAKLSEVTGLFINSEV